MDNKRKSQRTDLNTYVDVENKIRGLASDISEGGIRIVAKKSISTGTLLSVVIPLCSGRIEKGIIKVLALVKWNKKEQDGSYGHGLEFFYINDFEKAKLHSFVSEKLISS